MEKIDMNGTNLKLEQLYNYGVFHNTEYSAILSDMKF